MQIFYPQNVFAGPDSSKFIAPRTGIIWIATDTLKTYQCFIAGVWSLIASPALEEYINHTGVVDNYTQTGVSGGGSALTSVANHRIDLSTAAAAVSYAYFDTKKTWTLSPTPIVLNFIINNIANGSGGDKYTQIGLMGDFTQRVSFSDCVILNQGQNNLWRFISYNGGSSSAAPDLTINNGDLITIVASSTRLMMFINGVIQSTITTNIATAAMYAGANVVCDAASGTARTVSIDMMSIKTYL